MEMMKYLTKGTVTAALSVVALLVGAFGMSHLSAFFNDPETASDVLTVVGIVGSLVASAMKGVNHDEQVKAAVAASKTDAK